MAIDAWSATEFFDGSTGLHDVSFGKEGIVVTEQEKQDEKSILLKTAVVAASIIAAIGLLLLLGCGERTARQEDAGTGFAAGSEHEIDETAQPSGSGQTGDDDEWLLVYEYEVVETADMKPPPFDIGATPRYCVINDVIVETGRVVCKWGLITGECGLSGYSYRIDGDVLYIHLRLGYLPHYAGSWLSDIEIEDDRISDIGKVILWDEDISEQRTIWGRTNGFQRDARADINEIISLSVYVEGDSVFYQGRIESDTLGYVGFGYVFHNNTLYLRPSVNHIPDFAVDGEIEITFDNERIGRIARIVLGNVGDETSRTIWNRENGFLGPYGITESLERESGLSVGGYIMRQQ